MLLPRCPHSSHTRQQQHHHHQQRPSCTTRAAPSTPPPPPPPDSGAGGGAPAPAVPKPLPKSRRNISERIEQLKRQNESLKQAIGVFLDQPSDVGAVTGKPSGVWDEGGTASLLQLLKQRRAAAAGLTSDSDDEGSKQQPEQPAAGPRRGAAAGAQIGAAAADGSSAVASDGEGAPPGPIFSTSMLGEAWVEPTAAAPAEAAAADVVAPTAPPAAAAPVALQPAAAAQPTASSGIGAAMAQAAAAPGVATPGVAAPPGGPSTADKDAKTLGTIHERVEEMERQREAEAARQAAIKATSPKRVQAQAVKPRATVRKPPPALASPLSLVFVSAEVAPWSKTGGLGDVMGALPEAMAERGHTVMVVSPRYTNGGKDVARYKDAVPQPKSVWVELKGAWHELKYHVLHQRGVDYVFIEHIAFERPGTPYGDASGPFKDNLFRFALLALGGLEAPLNLPIKRDRSGKLTKDVYGQQVMFVANDWHAALLPLLLAARFRPYNVYESARCCLAIHNLSHQGSFEAHAFSEVSLPGEWYGSLEWQNPDDRNRRRTINVLKAGIVTSDVLITVSQGYAAEITGQPQDNRVDMLLAQRAPRLRGIVNGVDVAEWDPGTDAHLAQTYSADDLSGKAACKRALQREFRLDPDPDIPLIGFIGRLDYQKGPDLILDALPNLSNLECQIVILGTGAADYEARVKSVSGEWGWFARGHVGFSVPLGHKILAGCDILLMPSRFEPCGLNQLYAMRYGTVPIAHATGGLTDTIGNYNPFSKGDGEGEGWTFAPAAIEPMVSAVSEAVKVFKEEPDKWRALQLRGMAKDCSWRRAAEQYEQVLSEAMADVVQYQRT